MPASEGLTSKGLAVATGALKCFMNVYGGTDRLCEEEEISLTPVEKHLKISMTDAPVQFAPFLPSCHLLWYKCLVFCDANVARVRHELTGGDYDADVCGYRRHKEKRRVLTDSCPFQLSTPLTYKLLEEYDVTGT
ncbi:hypothetical protein IRJ41_009968 [Triplophysa rosa]|uniref:Uncharacterized protein n=1 Tax=Triplophysa rosa TaxID=992332 RepID=A0A9W7WZN3_TRIRA|nr:hypothetical protein IRJ41_009968 [Triplophysa rosa]